MALRYITAKVMAKQAIFMSGLITIAVFVQTKAVPLPCFDHQLNQRQPGEKWFKDPTTNCICTEYSSVLCQKLNESVCMDIRGNLRKNREAWMNSSCVACECVNGTINCTGYDVNITHGLYSVELLPTCEQCAVLLRTQEPYSTCKVYLELFENGNMTECASGGLYIRDIHRCNGIAECPDESDENGCEDAICKDEEGSLFLIKDENGLQLSRCMDCHCEAGFLTCRRNLTINFPGYYYGLYEHIENCAQPQCNVAKFVREKRHQCEGVEFTTDDGIYYKGQTWKYAGCDFYFPGCHFPSFEDRTSTLGGNSL
ncbi:uncharacterized protein LOC110049574 [Orbicella faveolata]|uniref:uncharacterized protein LOC110049574 n=1 Tax=Orbicella faveolata TaxID=48498 RepID=UPI0009E57BDD|nr:uncharacterized protein LOC110049574 [Orbicella faveolata]